MVVLPGGDLLVGDVGGSVRAYRQLQDVTEDGRPACPGPPRAHGTVKYTHPKDPTRPLLVQVSNDTFRSLLVTRNYHSDGKFTCTSVWENAMLQLYTGKLTILQHRDCSGNVELIILIPRIFSSFGWWMSTQL